MLGRLLFHAVLDHMYFHAFFVTHCHLADAVVGAVLVIPAVVTIDVVTVIAGKTLLLLLLSLLVRYVSMTVFQLLWRLPLLVLLFAVLSPHAS